MFKFYPTRCLVGKVMQQIIGVDTVSMNKILCVDTVSTNKILCVDTVSTNKAKLKNKETSCEKLNSSWV